jgi:hypothetical protein
MWTKLGGMRPTVFGMLILDMWIAIDLKEKSKVFKCWKDLRTYSGGRDPIRARTLGCFSPDEQLSLGGMRYMLAFIDDFSMFVCVYFMKENSKVFTNL